MVRPESIFEQLTFWFVVVRRLDEGVQLVFLSMTWIRPTVEHVIHV